MASKIKLEVRSKGPNGFRRAGQFFGPDPVEVELDEAPANMVMREKMLFVRRLDGGPMPADDEAPEAQASGLMDGMRQVPSDLTGGKPEGAEKASKPHDEAPAKKR